MKSFITNSKEETIALAEKLAGKLENHDIIFYIGGLGMGKTAFTQGLCNGLGIKAEVTSPTFAIVNEYTDAQGEAVYHFDFYRIKKLAELYDLGFDNYLEEANTGKGLKMSKKFKPYFQFVLPILILVILVQGLI